MTLHYEDVTVGQSFGPLTKGPMSPAHIMRWSAAIENFHRIHYDKPFAVEHDGLPDILVNGSWKQHVLVQLVKDALGPDGWLARLSFRYKAMDVVGTTIIAKAEVTDKAVVDGLGLLTLKLVMQNQDGIETTTGWAFGLLPLKQGSAVPYPFVPGPELTARTLPEGA